MKALFKSLLYLSLFFRACLVNANENQDPAKHQKWIRTYGELAGHLDIFGYTYNTPLKETVVALKVLGFDTLELCSGHVDGNPTRDPFFFSLSHDYPWLTLDIITPEIHDYQNQESLIFDQLLQEERKLNQQYSDLSREQLSNHPDRWLVNYYDAEWKKLSTIITELKKHRLQDLHVLLNQFYKTRDSSYDCMLVLKSSFNPNECLLHSVGGELQLIRSKEERVIQLDAYQNEMNKFTEFLKKHYFQSDL